MRAFFAQLYGFIFLFYFRPKENYIIVDAFKITLSSTLFFEAIKKPAVAGFFITTI